MNAVVVIFSNVPDFPRHPQGLILNQNFCQPYHFVFFCDSFFRSSKHLYEPQYFQNTVAIGHQTQQQTVKRQFPDIREGTLNLQRRS